MDNKKDFDSNTLTNNSDFDEILAQPEGNIKVIGVGGGGCNAVDNMILCGIKNVDFICANTDSKALNRNRSFHKIRLGNDLTRGLGAGSRPEIGKKAALEDREKIREILKGTDLLFITAGMGGGTGTGAAPVIADLAKELGILTVGVVTKPFLSEGEKRKKIADEGIAELKNYVDSLIVLPNEKLLQTLSPDISLRDAFLAADEILKGAVIGITEVIKTPGIISLDFSDIKTVMSGRGLAMMGSAYSSSSTSNNRAEDAAKKAIYSPLLHDISLEGAKGILVNISSAPGSLKIQEYQDILKIINPLINDESDLKVGMAEVEGMPEDQIHITVIATGLDESKEKNTPTNNPALNYLNRGDDVMNNTEGNDNFNSFSPSNKNIGAFFRRNRS